MERNLSVAPGAFGVPEPSSRSPQLSPVALVPSARASGAAFCLIFQTLPAPESLGPLLQGDALPLITLVCPFAVPSSLPYVLAAFSRPWGRTWARVWGSWAWAICAFTCHQLPSASHLPESCGNPAHVGYVPRPPSSHLFTRLVLRHLCLGGPQKGQSLGSQAVVILWGHLINVPPRWGLCQG